MDNITLFLLAGACVGFAVGLTGVGGGSLMTPILLLLGIPPHIAVGTDLLFATITKSGSVVAHARNQTIDWSVSKAMLLGSLPASILTIVALHTLFPSAEAYGSILTSLLGVMLLATAGVLIFKKAIQRVRKDSHGDTQPTASHGKTVITGVVLGVCVTLTSVGAGAVGTAALMLLYPAWRAARIVGTDLAHAVPLTCVAGLGHLAMGNVDGWLLITLLVTSLPATWLGATTSKILPNHWLQPLLTFILLGLGIRYCFF